MVRGIKLPFRRVRVAAVVSLALTACLLAGCLGPGQHPITATLRNGTISGGLWRTLGGEDCRWNVQVLRWWGGGWPAGAEGPQLAEIPQISESSEGLAAFNTSGCSAWWREPGPFARPLATPGQPFGAGEYQVGYEIASGTYRASHPSPVADKTDPSTCYWARLSGFGGSASVIVDGGGPAVQTVTIEATDRGFHSQHCGTWTRVG